MDLAPTMIVTIAATALALSACSSSRPNAETVSPEQGSDPASAEAAKQTEPTPAGPTAEPKSDGDAEAPLAASAKAFDEKAFVANKKGVPSGAIATLKSVRQAASTKSWPALRKTMGTPFTFSHGHDKDPNLAVPYWKASGEDIFAEIVKVVDGPCEKLIDGMGEVFVSCPTQAALAPNGDLPYGGYLASLVDSEDGWRLIAFVAGD